MLYNRQPNRNFVRLDQSYKGTERNVKNITKRPADIIRKKFHEILGRFGLQVEIWCNHRVVNFLTYFKSDHSSHTESKIRKPSTSAQDPIIPKA